ncbi:MAG: DUF4956 domain-containing protein [Clostridiales bacterium]|nr:DUF4956 domain-containing protein [Clostridiales bacterium]
MTFNDIFKSSYIEQVNAFSLTDTLISLALAFAIGLFISEVYHKTYRGVMYSRSFGATLLALTLITDLAIMTVTSNVVLSLGMVGALSIVRFRTAIKEPLDIAFLFWAIVTGIMLGAGMILLAIIGNVVMGLIMVLFVNRKGNETPYILVLQCADDAAEERAMAQVEGYVARSLLKSKTVNKEGIELTVEVRLADSTTKFINELSAMDGVRYATLVSYNGEYMS